MDERDLADTDAVGLLTSRSGLSKFAWPSIIFIAI